MNFLSNKMKFGVAVLSVALLSACGDDDDDDTSSREPSTTPTPTPTATPTPTPTVSPAAFTGNMNVPVISTLGYTTTTNPTITQVTSSTGAFGFDTGDTVSFAIGGLNLGSVVGQTNVSLFDLVGSGSILSSDTLVNIARTLLTLDTEPATAGIQLTPSILANAEIYTGIGFDLSQAVFESTIDAAASSPLDAITGEVNVDLVSVEAAEAYLLELGTAMMVNQAPLNYEIEFFGTSPTNPDLRSFGTLTLEIQSDGTVSGSMSTNDEETQFDFAGLNFELNAEGNLAVNIIDPNANLDAMHFEFNTVFNVLTNELSGAWDNNQPGAPGDANFDEFFASGSLAGTPVVPTPAP